MKLRFIFGFILGLLVLSSNMTVAVDVPGTGYQIETNSFIAADSVCIDINTAVVDVGFGIEKELNDSSLSVNVAETMPLEGKWVLNSIASEHDFINHYSARSLIETKSNIGKQSNLKRGYVKWHIGPGDSVGGGINLFNSNNSAAVELAFIGILRNWHESNLIDFNK